MAGWLLLMFRWNVESWSEEKSRKNAKFAPKWVKARQWNKWFAWYPVRVIERSEPNETEGWEHNCIKKVWLCWVERKLNAYWTRENNNYYYWDIRQYIYR